MPQYLTVVVEDVYTDAGVVPHEQSADGLRPARPFDFVKTCGAMLYWPAALGWLDVQLDARSPGGGPRRFLATQEGVEAVCRTHGVEPRTVAPGAFAATNQFRVGTLMFNSGEAVTLRLAVDTAHDGFRKLARDANAENKPGVVVDLQVLLFDRASTGTAFKQAGTVQVVLRPARAFPPFYGVVALDLGNTSTAVACVSRRDPVHRSDSLRMLDAEDERKTELTADQRSVTSSLLVSKVVSLARPADGPRRFPDLPEDDDPRAVVYAVGRRARPGFGPGLVLGPKRLVSGGDGRAHSRLVTLHQRGPGEPESEEEVELLNRVPAELVACRALESFRRAAKAWPGELAVTYPTTYTPKEIDRLAQAVERGWLRMNGLPQRLGGPPPDDPALQPLVSATQARLQSGGTDDAAPGAIRLKLDEATAAAFFFLYRRVFESPGGLLRFRYLYPAGLNLLIYDFGGGTTDIALVKATSNNDRHLKVGVLGRTGMRGFGGDNMTRCVAQLLKWKLAAILAQARGKAPPAAPTRSADPAAVRRAFDESGRKLRALDPADELVPTTFDRRRTDPAARARRQNAAELFQLAEQVKKQLAGDPGGAAKLARPLERSQSSLENSILQGLSDAQFKQVQVQCLGLTVHRWEADALIDAPPPGEPGGPEPKGPLTRSIEKCNKLVHEVLRGGDAPAAGGREEEVHWVVLSGNAALYPLVMERLRADLQVEGLEDERVLTRDASNLKSSVAKGAVLFRVATHDPQRVVVETDTRLSECLPFDVGYKDLARNVHAPLYREQTPYRDMGSRAVKVEQPDSGPGGEQRTFFLARRFPGDDEYSPFLAFEFPQQPTELEVAYDPVEHEFRVADKATGTEGVRRDLTDADLYVAPAERGDL